MCIKLDLDEVKISFVIPCYKSKNTIGDVLEEIKRTMASHINEYEIILINDYPMDDTFDKIKEICDCSKNVKALNMSMNFGQHAALMAGYRLCTGDVIVSLDDDNQTPANEVFLLLNKLNEGYDVVYASYERKKYNSLRSLGSKINDVMIECLINKPRNLKVSSFYVARKFVIDEVIKYENSYPYLLGLVLRVTNNIANVNVTHRERKEGKSGYSLKKLISLWLNGFTAFSVKPLRIATISGFIFAFVGFLFVVYIVIHKFLNPNIAIGWSSIVATMLIIGGIQMLMIGLIGEYVGRIYISINKSPQYVIKEKVNIDEYEER